MTLLPTDLAVLRERLRGMHPDTQLGLYEAGLVEMMPVIADSPVGSISVGELLLLIGASSRPRRLVRSVRYRRKSS